MTAQTRLILAALATMTSACAGGADIGQAGYASQGADLPPAVPGVRSEGFTERTEAAPVDEAIVVFQAPQRIVSVPSQAPLLDAEVFEAPQLAPVVAPPAPHALPVGAVCSFTASDWGAECSSTPESSAGCTLAEHFDAVFESGLTIGSVEHQVHFTSAKAIQEALPGLSSPRRAFDKRVDPAQSQVDELLSALVSLELNLRFSAQHVIGEQALGTALLTEGPFAGWYIDDVHSYAQAVYSGEVGLLNGMGLTLQTLADALVAVNAVATDCYAGDQLRR